MSSKFSATEEIQQRQRFQFGNNWKDFLTNLGEHQVQQAEFALKELLGLETLHGKTFLDVGSGSGLHSLAARRLGAQVFSFDYDVDSTWCTMQLKERYFPDDSLWSIEQGSVLDEDFLNRLGQFDIVFSWGVLHHTGNMWPAIELSTRLVNLGGCLILALYNDQGWASKVWWWIKRSYNLLPRFLRPLMTIPYAALIWGPVIVKDALRRRPLNTWQHYYQQRGMSPWHDVVDWVGGYPFEVARPEDVIAFAQRFGFEQVRLILIQKGSGNNQYVFRRNRKTL